MGESTATIGTQIEIYFTQITLDRNWYGVSPEHEGAKAMFIIGK